MSEIILIILFFLIALIYASVGFGGGSSYLALLGQAVFMFSQVEIKSTALLCNIIVVTGGSIIFYREGKVAFREFWPYLIASVPMAYLGGYWKLEDQVFFILLGSTLIVASVLLWWQPEIHKEKIVIPKTTATKFLLGGAIGFLSGLVSIGGGIFLSPILHLLRWGKARKIAALASIFILVNSIGGLIGLLQRGIPEPRWTFLLPLLLAVFIGGQIGSRLGAKKFNALYIKRITAGVILIAGLNILKDQLFN